MSPPDDYRTWEVLQRTRDVPLVISANPSGFTCVLCGAEQEPHAWRVRLPERLGTACPGCASDRGWSVS